MSTKKETTSTGSSNSNFDSTNRTTRQFDPASMNAFHALLPQMVSGLSDYVKDPNKMVNAWFQSANNQIGQVGNRLNSTVLNNTRSGGFGGGNLPAFLQASLARNARAVGGYQGNAWLNSLFRGDDSRKWALSMMQSYQPLETGQTSHQWGSQNGTQSSNTVEKTSGTGTWLPQLAAAGIGAAMAPFTGGMSLAGSAKAIGGMGGGAPGTSSFNNPFAPTGAGYSSMASPAMPSWLNPNSYSALR